MYHNAGAQLSQISPGCLFRFRMRNEMNTQLCVKCVCMSVRLCVCSRSDRNQLCSSAVSGLYVLLEAACHRQRTVFPELNYYTQFIPCGILEFNLIGTVKKKIGGSQRQVLLHSLPIVDYKNEKLQGKVSLRLWLQFRPTT